MNEDINVGAISEALNNKVDLNQLNTNAQGLSYASGWGMPSSRYIDLTLGASGTTYTAPANGWYICEKVSSATNQYIIFLTSYGRLISWNGVSSPTSATNIIPVKKGDTITVSYNLGGATAYFRFIYAQGEQN